MASRKTSGVEQVLKRVQALLKRAGGDRRREFRPGEAELALAAVAQVCQQRRHFASRPDRLPRLEPALDPLDGLAPIVRRGRRTRQDGDLHRITHSPDDLRAAHLDDVRAFFARHYHPANASLALAGDVDPETRGFHFEHTVEHQLIENLLRVKPAQLLRNRLPLRNLIELALDVTLRYTRERQAFGQPLADFQNTRFKLAEVATVAHVVRSFVNDCTQRLVDGTLDNEAAYMAKWWCTEQQCRAGLAGKVAMRWISPHMERRDYTFRELNSQSSRFANVLQGLGLHAGDVIQNAYGYGLFTGARYFRYRVILFSDPTFVYTPTVNQVTVIWSP